jgi:FkbM family methyltransferase
MCLNKFRMIDKIKLYQSGLSSENKVVDFHIDGEASSIYFGSVLGEFGINLKKIDEFLLEEKIEIVDLIKMNIEGSEYELLEYMLNNNLITKFKNLQIQFHDNVFDGWEQKYNNIKENLKKTHHLTYEFEFKFENWEIN